MLNVDQQRACLKALGEIFGRVAAYERSTGHELPALVWTIGFEGMSAEVDDVSTVVVFGPRPSKRDVFDHWVKAIGAEPKTDIPTSDGRRFLSAALRINGTVAVLRTITEEGRQG